jgi:hypothetical protein
MESYIIRVGGKMLTPYSDALYCRKCAQYGRTPPNKRDTSHSYCKECRAAYANDRYHGKRLSKGAFARTRLLVTHIKECLSKPEPDIKNALVYTKLVLDYIDKETAQIAQELKDQRDASKVAVTFKIAPLPVMLSELTHILQTVGEGAPWYKDYYAFVKLVHPEWDSTTWDNS